MTQHQMVICFTNFTFVTLSSIPTAEKKPLQYEQHTRSTTYVLYLYFVESESIELEAVAWF